MTKMHHATVDGVSGASLDLRAVQPRARRCRRSARRPSTPPMPKRPRDRDIVLDGAGRRRQAAAALRPGAAAHARRRAALDRTRAQRHARCRRRSPRRAHRSTARSPGIAASRSPGSSLDDDQGDQERLRHDRQRRRAGDVLRRVAALPRRQRRAARRRRWSPWCRCRCTARPTGAARTRCPACSRPCPATSPIRRSGCSRSPRPTASSKEHHQTLSASLLQDWAQFAAPNTFGLAVRVYSKLRLADRHPVVHNLVISNVPGSADADLLRGRADRRLLPVRAGVPRRRTEHHRAVERRARRRRADRQPRAGARSVDRWPTTCRCELESLLSAARAHVDAPTPKRKQPAAQA